MIALAQVASALTGRPASAAPPPAPPRRPGRARAASTIAHLVELADRQVVGHLDDAVDLRRLAVLRATPGSSTSTVTVVPISASRRAAVIVVLQLAQLGQALVHQRRVDRAVEARGVRAVLGL